MVEVEMKVVITGGSGMIGRALTAALVDNGHEVVILSRNPKKVLGLPKGATVVGWDGKTAKGWGDIVNESDAIVNLAGTSIGGEPPLNMRWTKKRKALIRSSRINANKAVVEAITKAEKKPNVLLQAAAIGYYGFHDDEELDESSPPASDFMGTLVQEWEGGTRAVEDQGVRHVVMRNGLVLSDKGGVMPLFKLQFNLFVGGWMGSGKQYYSWVHVDDVVAAIKFLLANETTRGAYNLTSPQPEINKEFSKTLGQVMRRPAWFPMPEFALRLVLGEVADLTMKGQRVLPKRLLEAGYVFKFPTLKEAFKDLVGN
jgi:uncharacterized protein (TIGR01777 family)